MVQHIKILSLILSIFFAFLKILKEVQLMELRSLGVDNLTLAISTAKQQLRSLPSVILMQTKEVRSGKSRVKSLIY